MANASGKDLKMKSFPQLDRILLAATVAVVASAQAPSPVAPAFEVASIRPKSFEQMRQIVAQFAATGSFSDIEIDPGRVRIAAIDLAKLIRTAYGIKDYQLEGPEWLIDPDIPTMYEIEATLPAGATRDQVPLMLQNLLKERFKLAIRKGSKEADTYALLLGKNGPSFKPKEISDQPDLATSLTQGAKGEITTIRNGTKETSAPGRGSRVETSTLGGLVDYLSRRLDKPVIDKTGLKGNFDITLQVLPTGPLAGAPTDPKELLAYLRENPDVTHAPLVAAVERLGLKLERQKNPVETIIIEHAEKTPSEN